MRQEFKVGTVGELDTRVAVGMSRVWKQIKARTGSKQVRPKWVTITDEPSRVYANDFDIAYRFAVDLTTMTVLSEVGLYTGECAINSRGEEKAVSGIPVNVAVVTFVYCDYYRTSTLTVEVNSACLQRQLPESAQAVIA